MFNPDKPAILSDNRPIVHRPEPRTEPEPKRATKRSRKYHPSPTPQHQTKAVPRRATGSPKPPPAHPFFTNNVNQQTPGTARGRRHLSLGPDRRGDRGRRGEDAYM